MDDFIILVSQSVPLPLSRIYKIFLAGTSEEVSWPFPAVPAVDNILHHLPNQHGPPLPPPPHACLRYPCIRANRGSEPHFHPINLIHLILSINPSYPTIATSSLTWHRRAH
jgi:hypothetical protein